MIKIVSSKDTAPSDITLKGNNDFIRFAINLRCILLLKALKMDKVNVNLFCNPLYPQPKRTQLYPSSFDKLFLNTVTDTLLNKLLSSKYSLLLSYYLMQRIQRDLLFDSATRELRLLAGIQNTLRKSWADNQKGTAII